MASSNTDGRVTATTVLISESAAIAAASPSVLFDNVWFAFDDLVVLRGVSFSVPTGCMRVLLGASGSGKSVVLKLILGCCGRTRGPSS
jgi:ABC-type transporter Mla maintaining outer membrane lipid asymmetry ATPase subunit MlaF